jgi:hypothetical protein
MCQERPQQSLYREKSSVIPSMVAHPVTSYTRDIELTSVVDPDPVGSSSFGRIRIYLNQVKKLNYNLFQKISIYCPKYGKV